MTEEPLVKRLAEALMDMRTVQHQLENALLMEPKSPLRHVIYGQIWRLACRIESVEQALAPYLHEQEAVNAPH